MKIRILSKGLFNKVMIDNKITPENINKQKDIYIISINDTEGEMSTSYFENVESENLLKLYFDDTDEDKTLPNISGGDYNLKTMSEKQGEEIIEFLTKVKSNLNDNTTLIIHCTAGQNRSGSVGKFAADFFEYDQDILLRENPFIKGNSVVTRVLNKLWMWSHYK